MFRHLFKGKRVMKRHSSSEEARVRKDLKDCDFQMAKKDLENMLKDFAEKDMLIHEDAGRLLKQYLVNPNMSNALALIDFIPQTLILFLNNKLN